MKLQLPVEFQVWWWLWRGTWTHTYRPSWQWEGHGEGFRGCPSLAGRSQREDVFDTELHSVIPVGFSSILSPSVTHPSYGSVSEEARCKAAHETSHLQSTHVGAACEQHSWHQHPKPVRLREISERQWTFKMHTHESSLAFFLHEEQLSPVSGSCLHPEHHQVAQRQHPQERGEEELTQGAFTVAWWVQRGRHIHKLKLTRDQQLVNIHKLHMVVQVPNC